MAQNEPLRTRLGKTSLGIPAWVLLMLGILAPLVLLIYFGLLTGPNLDGGVTGAEWQRIWNEPNVYGKLLIRSIGIGAGATVLTLLIGFPTAWVISRYVKRKTMALVLLIVPNLTSNLLLIYAVFVMIAPGGVTMKILDAMGLASADGGILYTRWAVLIMLAYMYLPLMTIALFTTVEGIDSNVLNAAKSLGAGSFKRFLHVIFPLSLPGLIAGLVIVFTPVTGSFVEAAILGGTDGMMFGTLIDGQLSSVNNEPRAAAMSIMLLVSIIGILVVLQFGARLIAPGALRRKQN